MKDKDALLKLVSMLCDTDETKEDGRIGGHLLGKYVICRSRNEGINCGYLVDMDDTGVVLRDARRIWYHKPKDVNTSWYEGVATSGLSDDSKISCAVTSKVIIEDYSLTECSIEARKSLTRKQSNGQN